MKYEINYSPDAEQDLIAIFRWIADQSSSQTAERFVMDIYDCCDDLGVIHWSRARENRDIGLVLCNG